MKMHIWSHN